MSSDEDHGSKEEAEEVYDIQQASQDSEGGLQGRQYDFMPSGSGNPPCFWSLQSAYCDWRICRNLLTGLHVSATHRGNCLVGSHAHKGDARLIHSCKAAPMAGPCAVPVNGMIGSMPRQRPLPSARPLAPPPRGPHSGRFCASMPRQWGRPLHATAWRLGKKTDASCSTICCCRSGGRRGDLGFRTNSNTGSC